MRDRDAPLTAADMDALAWGKMDGLLPAIVQDAATAQVLMLGYMDRAALEATLTNGFVTFFSRSKARLWQKGETSGNCLAVKRVFADCDEDALLIEAEPKGPTCHLDTPSCFRESSAEGLGFLGELTRIIHQRAVAGGEASYTKRLLGEGINRIAQKVGEEGVEVALAAVTDGKVAEEAADLLYHLAVLLEAKDLGWDDVSAVLRARHK